MRTSSPSSGRRPDSRDISTPALSRLGAKLRGIIPRGRWSRAVRRAIAVTLFVIAGVVAVRQPDPPGTSVVVSTRDLEVGTVVGNADVALARRSDLPAGTVDRVETVVGRTLTTGVRRGEIVTDARLLSGTPDPGSGRVAIPVRVADGQAAELLRPGVHLTLLGLDTRAGVEAVSASVVCSDAVVLLIPPAQAQPVASTSGRLIVVAVPNAVADKVSAAAATERVTFRFH